MAMRADQKRLLSAAGVAGVLYVIPVAQFALLPFVYWNTHVHELAHAIVAVLTGGTVDFIVVNANGSGAARIGGGSILLTASAGYVGSTVVGALMIASSRTERRARAMLGLASAFLAFGMVFWVRGDLVGILSGLVWAGLLALMATRLKGDSVIFAAQFLGVMMCLQSVQAFLALYNLSVYTEAHSDAEILETVTGIPAIAWTLAWMALAAVAMVGAFRAAWRPSGQARRDG